MARFSWGVGAALALAAMAVAVVVGGPWRERGPGRDGPSPRTGAAARETTETTAAADPFPLDGRTRVFDTRQGRMSEGVIAFERVFAGPERLADGHEYRVFETRVLNKSTGARRVVSREWLRATADAVLCSRRQEGPLVCDLEPPQPVVRVPLGVGQRWAWSGEAGGRPAHASWVVSGRESVAVHAGTFEEAWRIDMEVRSGDGGDAAILRTLWLQPGLGLVEERSRILLETRQLELDAALREVPG